MKPRSGDRGGDVDIGPGPAVPAGHRQDRGSDDLYARYGPGDVGGDHQPPGHEPRRGADRPADPLERLPGSHQLAALTQTALGTALRPKLRPSPVETPRTHLASRAAHGRLAPDNPFLINSRCRNNAQLSMQEEPCALP